MAGPRTCPFCGQEGKSSKEHVWAQWLRDYPNFKTIIAEIEEVRGKRFRVDEPLRRLDSEGRWELYSAPPRHVAEFLPFVTVPVCASCNNGWMSRLEQRAHEILDPLFPHTGFVLVSASMQKDLAAWAAKAFLAYTSVWDGSNNPFAPNEYKHLANSLEPPERMSIWMGRSCTPYGQIGMTVGPIPVHSIDTPGDNVGTVPPGAAEGHLSANCTVFIFQLLPTEMLNMRERIRPSEDCCWKGLKQLWPPTGKYITWPTPQIPADRFDLQRTYLHRLFAGIEGQPVIGATPKETEAAAKARLRAIRSGEGVE